MRTRNSCLCRPQQVSQKNAASENHTHTYARYNRVSFIVPHTAALIEGALCEGGDLMHWAGGVYIIFL